jgi:hypothetical protein
MANKNPDQTAGRQAGRLRWEPRLRAGETAGTATTEEGEQNAGHRKEVATGHG